MIKKTCPITVWDTDERDVFGRQKNTKCGKPVDRYGFCKKHADDKDRLTKRKAQ